MHLEELQRKDFARIYAAMEENFVPAERRDSASAEAQLEKKAYHVYHVCDADRRVGFVTVWELEDFAFVEHFVTYAECRNQGFGTQTLMLLKERYGRIVLEAEPPVGSIQQRRLAFYERNGFVANPAPYLQPPYRAGDAAVPLVLLSYPGALEARFTQTVKVIYREVYEIDNQKRS